MAEPIYLADASSARAFVRRKFFSTTQKQIPTFESKDAIPFAFVGPWLDPEATTWEVRWFLGSDSMSDVWVGFGDDNGIQISSLPSGRAKLSMGVQHTPMGMMANKVNNLPRINKGAVLVNAYSGAVI